MSNTSDWSKLFSGGFMRVGRHSVYAWVAGRKGNWAWRITYGDRELAQGKAPSKLEAMEGASLWLRHFSDMPEGVAA